MAKPALERWNQIVPLYQDLDVFRRGVINGRIDGELPRGLLWKVLLLYGTLDQSKWGPVDQAKRNQYEELRQKYKIVEDKPNVPLDPLSENHDGDIQTIIEQDVERTFPDIGFFRTPQVQEILTRILYIYSQTNTIGYRQGMHELVGPILWALANEQNDNVEADTFALFAEVMAYALPWYQPGEAGKTPEIVHKSQTIQNILLAKADPQVAHLLIDNDVEPQIWGLRYIRLMFGRELGFMRTLELWDAIFAADSTLQIVDYVCAVMIIRVRAKLLEASSHAELLETLLRYPSQDEPPHHYVSNAVYLKDNLSEEGGQHVARQYGVVTPKSPPHSPRLMNLESLMDAAKNVSQRWDVDRLKSAIDTRRRALSPSARAPSRDQALAETLVNSLDVLEKLDTNNNPDLEFALEGIRHVKECLMHIERPAIVFQSPRAQNQARTQPQPKSTGSPQRPNRINSPSGVKDSPTRISRSQTPRTSLADSEYAWMLGDEGKASLKSTESQSNNHDPFEL